ncbi:MAG: ABC transporter ATP-binding protein [Culicoidibacterales bacterium]
MFSRFISYYRPHRKLFVLDMMAALFMAGIDLIYPAFTARFIDDFIPNNNVSAIFVFVGILFALFVLRLACSYVVNYWGHIMGTNIEHDMRRDLFKKFQLLPFSYYDENKTGTIMTRITGDLRDITELAHHGPEDLLISIIMLVGSFFILLSMNVAFTLMIFPIVFIIIWFSLSRRNKMMQGFREIRKTHGEINSTIESSIGGIRLVQSFANEDFENERFRENNERYRNSWHGAYKKMAIFTSGNNFLIDMLNLVVLIVGALFVIQGQLAFGEFTAYLLYINFLVQPIRRLIAFMQQFQTGWAGFERFHDIMELEPEIVSPPNAVTLTDVKGEIIFDKASFTYPSSETPVLTDFSLTIPAGKKIALVGESGVGKSTISQLIPRFYDLTGGRLLIDGLAVDTLDLASLRSNIGHVQQDVYIFWGSISDNILYGNPNASEAEVIEAAKRAHIHDFICQLEDGYDTLVGERGVKLSGGQKQRIAIARVFLKNPQILILDEATSALDTITEFQVQQALDALTVGRTNIIIAHRLSTVKSADEIIVLGREGIAERGTHDQLMENHGYYYQLQQSNQFWE